MWLHIGVLGPKQFTGSLSCQFFGFINMDTATVISFPRIAFGIFVGQYAALGFSYFFGYKIFTGNQFNISFLSLLFLFNDRKHCRISHSAPPFFVILPQGTKKKKEQRSFFKCFSSVFQSNRWRSSWPCIFFWPV